MAGEPSEIRQDETQLTPRGGVIQRGSGRAHAEQDDQLQRDGLVGPGRHGQERVGGREDGLIKARRIQFGLEQAAFLDRGVPEALPMPQQPFEPLAASTRRHGPREALNVGYVATPPIRTAGERHTRQAHSDL